jgi:hypothetical protein
MKKNIVVLCFSLGIILLSCRERKLNISGSNIDYIVLKKAHHDNALMYHYDSIVIKDKNIFDTIYDTYLNKAELLKGSLIKFPADRYLMKVYKSNAPNDTLVISKEYAHIKGEKIDLVKMNKDIEPFLDTLFKKRFTDTSYCHLKRLEQDSLRPKQL